MTWNCIFTGHAPLFLSIGELGFKIQFPHAVLVHRPFQVFSSFPFIHFTSNAFQRGHNLTFHWKEKALKHCENIFASSGPFHFKGGTNEVRQGGSNKHVGMKVSHPLHPDCGMQHTRLKDIHGMNMFTSLFLFVFFFNHSPYIYKKHIYPHMSRRRGDI